MKGISVLPWKRIVRLLPSLFLIIVALIPRLYLSLERDFWSDEFFYHGKGFVETLKAGMTPQDNGGHLILFYLLRYFVVSISGDDRLAMRIIPVLEGAGGSLVIAFLSLLIFKKKVAFYIAGILAGLNPFYLYYSHESNIYAGTVLFSSLLLYTVLRFIGEEEDGRRPRLLYIFTLTAGLFNDLFFLLYFISIFTVITLYLFFKSRGLIRGWLTLQIIPAMLYIIYLSSIFLYSGAGIDEMAAGHTDPLDLATRLNHPIPFFASITRVWTEGIQASYPFFTPSWIEIPTLSLILLVLSLLYGIRFRIFPIILIFIVFILGILLVSGASFGLSLMKIGHFLDPRKVIWLLPHFILLITGAILSSGRLKIVSPFFFLYLTLPGLSTVYLLSNPDQSVSDMLEFIQTRLRMGDGILGTDFIPPQNLNRFPGLRDAVSIDMNEESIPPDIVRLWVICPRTASFREPVPIDSPLMDAIRYGFVDRGEWFFSSPITIKHRQESLLRLKVRGGESKGVRPDRVTAIIDSRKVPFYRGMYKVYLNEARGGEWGDSSGDRTVWTSIVRGRERNEIQLPELDGGRVYYLAVRPVVMIVEKVPWNIFRDFFTRCMDESPRFSILSIEGKESIEFTIDPFIDPILHTGRGVVIVLLLLTSAISGLYLLIQKE